MEDVLVDDERDPQWRIVLDENEGGRDDEKYLQHSKIWGVYTR